MVGQEMAGNLVPDNGSEDIESEGAAVNVVVDAGAAQQRVAAGQ